VEIRRRGAGPHQALSKSIDKTPPPPLDYIAFVTRALLTTGGISSICMALHLLPNPEGPSPLGGPSGGDGKSSSTSPHLVSCGPGGVWEIGVWENS
jgi:hypothetical protein